MATSHFCNGKWRPGTVAECNRHKRLDQRQITVYNRESERAPSSSGSGGDSGSSSAGD